MERQPGNLMLFYEMAAFLRFLVAFGELDSDSRAQAKALVDRFDEAHR